MSITTDAPPVRSQHPDMRGTTCLSASSRENPRLRQSRRKATEDMPSSPASQAWYSHAAMACRPGRHPAILLCSCSPWAR